MRPCLQKDLEGLGMQSARLSASVTAVEPNRLHRAAAGCGQLAPALPSTASCACARDLEHTIKRRSAAQSLSTARAVIQKGAAANGLRRSAKFLNRSD